MSEVKSVLKWYGFYALVQVLGSFLCQKFLSSSFLTYYIFNLFFLTVSIWLNVHYYLRVAGHRRLRNSMLQISFLMFLLFFLQCVKYSITGNTSTIGRLTWYAYYIPILGIPLKLFHISMDIYSDHNTDNGKKRNWLTAVTVVLILLVLSNDLHQTVFRFQPAFADWDSEYSYGMVFWILMVWEYGLYLAAIAVLVFKSTISGIRSQALLLLIPAVTGIFLILIIAMGKFPTINGAKLIEFPEAQFFMVACLLECSMQLGLIPANTDYQDLMKVTSVPVQITDRDGHVYYRSDNARVLPKSEIQGNSRRIDAHHILRRMDIPGGFGFWEEDVTELDRLDQELTEIRKQLREETDLIRLQNELKRKQAVLEQKTRVYDEISRKTQRQSQKISVLAHRAMRLLDPVERDACCREITLLGACIKRYANLSLLASENSRISCGELALSFSEVLRYLNRCGIPAEISSSAEGSISSEHALAVFEISEILLDAHYDELNGVYVSLSDQDDSLLVKLVLEHIQSADSGMITEILTGEGTDVKYEYEDGIGYFSFLMPKEEHAYDDVQ